MKSSALHSIPLYFTPIQEPNLARSWIYATPTCSYLSVRDRKRDGGPRQRARGSPIHARIAHSWTYKHRHCHRWSARYTRARVSQSQYLGQGQKVLRSPVRRDTGESLARRARCTFTSPVLPCAFANCNFDTDGAALLHREARQICTSIEFRVCKFTAPRRYGYAISSLMMLRANFGIGDPAVIPLSFRRIANSHRVCIRLLLFRTKR